MSNADRFEPLAQANPDALLADGFEAAYLGFVVNHHHAQVAVYDYQKCVQILMGDGISAEEAEEYLEFNTLSAFVGPNTPLFVRAA